MTVIGFRRVELISGVATGLLALLGPSSLNVTTFMFSTFPATEKIFALLSLVVTHIVPALLVAVGSYIHAVRQNASGFVIVLLGGSVVMNWESLLSSAGSSTR